MGELLTYQSKTSLASAQSGLAQTTNKACKARSAWGEFRVRACNNDTPEGKRRLSLEESMDYALLGYPPFVTGNMALSNIGTRTLDGNVRREQLS